MPTPGDQNCIAVCSVGVRPIELKWNSDLLQKKLTTPCFKGVSVLLIFFLLWNQLLISLISVVFLDLISLVSAYIFNFLAVLVFCLICPSFSNFFFLIFGIMPSLLILVFMVADWNCGSIYRTKISKYYKLVSSLHPESQLLNIY